jgi:DNA-directed RNA polymerase specialized sigma24 family protein
VPHRPDDRRSITAAGLAHLLARLGSDPDRAAIEYLQLRRTLVKFFDWRGAWAPEECADEALDRLARKLEADTLVNDVRSYALGIARLVLLERMRQPTLSPIEDLSDVADVPRPESNDDDDRLRTCFDRCLEEIPAEGRSLILKYYEGERDGKIANRRHLATVLGLSDNALRSRVQRLRDRLEDCVRLCVGDTDLKDSL